MLFLKLLLAPLIVVAVTLAGPAEGLPVTYAAAASRLTRPRRLAALPAAGSEAPLVAPGAA